MHSNSVEHLASFFISLVVARYLLISDLISDYKLMFIGTVNMIITYTIISSSKTTKILYLSIVPAFCHSFIHVTSCKVKAKLVEADEYGSVLPCIRIIHLLRGLFISLTEMHCLLQQLPRFTAD